MEAKIRINWSAGEIELAGSEEFVERKLDELADVIAEFEGKGAKGIFEPPAYGALPAGLPTTFGEYLAAFPSSISDVERALIAGHFAQSQSSAQVFSTRDVNESLLEQGVRLSNPSEALRQNVRTKRAFVVSKGQFRISKDGLAHIESLRKG